MGIKIVEAGTGDVSRIRELYYAVRHNNRPESMDQWRFNSPPEGVCPTVLAMDGETVAGMYTLWPLLLDIGGDKIKGGQSMDTLTHPEYQGQGIFTRLANACYEISRDRGIEVMYGFPNALSYPGFVRKLEWTHAGDVDHWVRPLKMSRHPGLMGVKGNLAEIAAAFLPKGPSGQFEIRYGKPDDQTLSYLLESWLADQDICKIARSPAWLSWRYSDDSRNGYKWVSAWKQGQPMALGIWGLHPPEWGAAADGRAKLVEMLGKDRKAMSNVLSDIIKSALQENAMLLETVCNVQTIIPVLKRAGFLKHRNAPLITRALGSKSFKSDVLDGTRWKFIGGDLDTF